MQTIYKILDFRCKNLNRAQVYFTHPFYKIDEWDPPFPTLFTPTTTTTISSGLRAFRLAAEGQGATAYGGGAKVPPMWASRHVVPPIWRNGDD